MARRRHAVALLLLISTPPALSQPPSASYTSNITIAVIVALAFFIYFFVHFALRFFNDGARTAPAARAASDPPTVGPNTPQTSAPAGRQRRGLEPEEIEALPTLEYGKVKALAAAKDPHRCAVCLEEFTDDELLRLIPGCCHVFHPVCLGTWLEDHLTCPICRADLSDPAVRAAADDVHLLAVSEEQPLRPDGAGASHVMIMSPQPSPRAKLRRARSELPAHIDDESTRLRLPELVMKEIVDESRCAHRRSVSAAAAGGGRWTAAPESRSPTNSSSWWSWQSRRRRGGEGGEGSGSGKRGFRFAIGAPSASPTRQGDGGGPHRTRSASVEMIHGV